MELNGYLSTEFQSFNEKKYVEILKEERLKSALDRNIILKLKKKITHNHGILICKSKKLVFMHINHTIYIYRKMVRNHSNK